MLRERSELPDIDILEETRGILWLGVRRYLMDRGDMAPPADPVS